MSCCKKVINFFVIFLVVWWVAFQGEDSNKVDEEKFLQKIKDILQEQMIKIKKQPTLRRRSKDKKEKEKVKKMIINKLSTPRFLQPKNMIIKVNHKGQKVTNAKSNIQGREDVLSDKLKGIPAQTLNKVLKANPAINPFRMDQLKKFLGKILRESSRLGGTSQTPPPTGEYNPQLLKYEEELKEWFKDVYSKVQTWWNMVYKLFVLDTLRFRYLEEVLCKDEIKIADISQHSSALGCLNLPKRFSVINLHNPTYMSCDSIDPYKLEVNSEKLGEVITCLESGSVSIAIKYDGKCTPSLYMRTTLIGDKNQDKINREGGIYPVYRPNKSLCYNLVGLNFFGYKNELYNILSPNINKTKEEIINYIFRKARNFVYYVQFIEKIFKEKVIPAVIDMCYEKCLCNDIGIKCKKDASGDDLETNLILLLYNATPIYKETIELWNDYTDAVEVAFISDPPCYQKFAGRIRDELSRIVREYLSNNPDGIPLLSLLKIEKDIEKNNLAGIFEKMYKDAPKLLVYILKSGFLNSIVKEFKQLLQNVIKGIEKKDRCFLRFAENRAWDEINKVDKKSMPYLSYLASKNLDAPAVNLKSRTQLMQGEVTIEYILSFLKVLNYRIYALLSSYKSQKCYYNRSDDTELKNEIDKYRCIFDNSNMEIGCSVEIFSFLDEVERKLLMELLKETSVTIDNLTNKISEIGKKGIGFYKKELVGQCKNIGETENRFIQFLKRNNLTNILTSICTPNNEKCDYRRCIEIIEEICWIDPLPECGKVENNSCHICKTDAVGTGAGNEKLMLVCKGVEEEIEKMYQTAYNDFKMEILLNRYHSCYGVLDPLYNICASGEKPERLVLCPFVNVNNIDTEKKMVLIKLLGNEYIKLLNQNSSGAKLKELYKKYNDDTICND